MFIGAYLFSTGVVFLVTLWLLTAVVSSDKPFLRQRQRLARFAFYSLAVSGLGFILFLGLSLVTGILPPIGSSGSYSLPQDYLAYGLLGWFILFVAAVGILSPALTAVWLRKHQQI